MKFLSNPFPASRSSKQNLLSALAFGLFVSGFLWGFKPFGLDTLEDGLVSVVIAYGAITSGCMSLAQFVLPVVHPRFYREETWTTGREIAQTMINILLIALVNWIYSASLGFFKPQLDSLLLFLGFTAAIGVFPVSVQVLIRQNAYHRKYSLSSSALNEQLDARESSPSNSSEFIELTDENGKTTLRLKPDQLIAIESADNYVKVNHLVHGQLECEMLRSSLTALEQVLSHNPIFFRTHRSWLVNLDFIDHVQGNARGYVLRMRSLTDTVPVARSRIDSFNKVMQ